MELFWNLSKHMISTQKIIQVGVLCLFGVPFFLQKTNKTMRTPAHVLSCSVERRSWTVAVLHWCCAVRFPRDNPSERPGDLPEQEQQRQISEEISFFFFGFLICFRGCCGMKTSQNFPHQNRANPTCNLFGDFLGGLPFVQLLYIRFQKKKVRNFYFLGIRNFYFLGIW